MNAEHITYQNNVDGFRVKYDLCIPEPVAEISANAIKEIDAPEDYAGRVERFLQEYSEASEELKRLTNHADGVDYAIAATAGIVTGMIDVFFVGEWDFASAKAVSNEEINRRVTTFAKKKGLDEWARKNGKDPNRLENAIQFLEDKFKLPGDGEYKEFKSRGVTDKTHHLDDFCHHPTFIGLICCILVQFTGIGKYHPSSGTVIPASIQVNQYGKFVSEETWGKVFSGIINWFFNVAETIKNREGHLFSDMAGSIGSAKKGNDGMGLPGSFLSTAKELSSLPCFRDSNFAENLRKAYQNGIGTGKAQFDLGSFNSLFSGASSKLDMRTEMAVGHELKRQARPVLLNEIIVRGAFFIRQFIRQMREKKSLQDIEWKQLFPIRNRTVVRMLTISTGTFTTIDLADAAIRASAKGAAFLPAFVLRINFVGVGRFSLALGADMIMGIQKGRIEVAMASAEVALTANKTVELIDSIEGIQQRTQERLNILRSEIEETSNFKY